MRFSLALVAAGFPAAFSQHDGATHGGTRAATSETNAVKGAANAPQGCKKLPVDADWPSKAMWDSELRGTESIPDTKIKHPQFAYETGKVENIQKAVRFASKHNVRLSIISSGHDFLSRNDAPSGIILPMEKFKGIHMIDDYKPNPNGQERVSKSTKANVISPKAGKQAAITVGAGISGLEANTVALQSGMVVLCAAHPEVSLAGGWVQSGGHSPFSTIYGLGADSALEFQVVTADGNFTIANEVVNQDLFWALRGGGGGTWGVVTQATFKLHPFPTIQGYKFWMNTTDFHDQRSIYQPAAYLTQQTKMLQDNNMAMFAFIHPNAMNVVIAATGQNASPGTVKKMLDPLFDKLLDYPGMSKKTSERMLLPDFGNLAINSMNAGMALMVAGGIFSALAGGALTTVPPPPPGSPTKLRKKHEPGQEMVYSLGIQTMDSRLWGQKHLDQGLDNIAAAYEKAMPVDKLDGQLRLHMNIGGAVWNGTAKETSVHPFWREARVHAICTGYGGCEAKSLHDFAPDAGSYPNEALYRQVDWKNQFWGSNYERLSQIKEKWDPNMVFYANPGINADYMATRDGRLCFENKGRIRAAGMAPPPSDNPNTYAGYIEPPSFPWLYQGRGKAPSVTNNAWLASWMSDPKGWGARFENFFTPSSTRRVVSSKFRR